MDQSYRERSGFPIFGEVSLAKFLDDVLVEDECLVFMFPAQPAQELSQILREAALQRFASKFECQIGTAGSNLLRQMQLEFMFTILKLITNRCFGIQFCTLKKFIRHSRIVFGNALNSLW